MKESLLSWKVQLTFIVTGIFVGILVTAQFRSAIPTSSYVYDEIQAQQELIKSYTDDQSILKDRIISLREQIDQKQQQASAQVEKNNLDILNALKKDLGLEITKGPGVEILLQDGASSQRTNANISDQSLIHAADLRDIINLLFSTQAEAIVINGQRIISSTSISSVGNTILVNNFHLLPPFKIETVGEPEVIIRILNDSKSLPDLQKRAKNNKIHLSFAAKNLVIAPIYSSDFPLKYIKALP